MEEALDLHIDAETLKENFSKKEIEVIKQLQSTGADGKKGPTFSEAYQGKASELASMNNHASRRESRKGVGPQMTPHDRNILMEKLHSINNKPKKEFKDSKEMSPQELAEYKQDIKNRLRSKINFKAQSRGSKSTNMGSILNKHTDTNNNTEISDINNDTPMTIDSMKDMVGKMSGSNSNPEVQKKLESLFSSEGIGDLLKDESMKDKMADLMKNNGFDTLFKQFSQQTSTKKKRCKKKKKPPSVMEAENNTDVLLQNDEEELLDDFIKND